MKSIALFLATAVSVAALAVTGCGQAAPAAPTAAPKAAEPTKAAAAAPTAVPAAAPTAAPKKVDWPQKGQTLKILMPVAAGGGMDILGRLTAPLLEKDLGIPVQVENKPGASQQVCLTELSKAKPDGYTIMYSGSPTIQVATFDPSRKATFTRQSFVPIAVQLVEPGGIAVRPDGPYKTLKDLMDAAKAKGPGQVKMALSGLLSATQFTMFDLEKAAGVKFGPVVFDGQAPMLTALLGGHVDAMVGWTGDISAKHKTGEIRVIAVTDKQENRFLPGVPTAAAQGYPTYWTVSRSLIAPAGVPKEIVDKLAASIKKANESTELKTKAEELGFTLKYLGPEEYAKWWDEEDARVKPLVEQALKEGANK